MGMACFKDGNGSIVVIYSVKAMNRSLLESSNLQLGILNDATLGG